MKLGGAPYGAFRKCCKVFYTYLSAALDTDHFMKNYDREKVAALIEDVESLSKTTSSQPHATYFHGLQSKSINLCRINPDITYMKKSLEAKIHQHLPNITGQPTFIQTVRDLVGLPSRPAFYIRKQRTIPIKPSLIKLKPRKKFKRRGEKHKHCLPLNYLQSSQILLHMSWKLQRRKEIQIVLPLFQLLNMVLH